MQPLSLITRFGCSEEEARESPVLTRHKKRSILCEVKLLCTCNKGAKIAVVMLRVMMK